MHQSNPTDPDAIYLGAMSGTSMDGLDLVAVTFDAQGIPCLQSSAFEPYPAELKAQLLELAHDANATVDTMCAADVRLGQFYAASINQFIAQQGLERKHIAAIGSHGQTIRHQPSHTYPYTLQIGDPNTIAGRCSIRVVADFRRRDIVLGGQGAPLAPAFHDQVFRSADCDRVILNIGGIANITYLPADSNQPVIGFDTGPGNTLLDSLSRRHFDRDYDRDGEIASRGTPDLELVEAIYAQEAYFHLPSPKSTGTDYFDEAWMQACGLDQLPAADAMASAAELVSVSIARAVKNLGKEIGQIFICGGGAHNLSLRARIAHYLPAAQVATTEQLGIHPGWVEACAFAWLAWRTLNFKAGNLPSVTHAEKFTILGSVHY